MELLKLSSLFDLIRKGNYMHLEFMQGKNLYRAEAGKSFLLTAQPS